MSPNRLAAIGLTVLALVASVLALRMVAAYAQTGTGGFTGGGSIGAGVSVPGGTGTGGGGVGYVPVGTGGSTAGGSSGGGAAPTAVWVRHYYYGEDPSAGSGGTNAPGFCAAPTVSYQDVLVDNATGAILDSVSGCTAPAQPGQPVVAPPPPPPPPTPAEAWNLVALPVPSFGVAPVGTGLTGLATHLWDSNGSAAKTATATIRGYLTTTTARPIRWTWDMVEAGPASRSNPAGTLSATRPGTAATPATTYTYETVGGYTIRLTVTWGGSYSFTGSGVSVTRDLGTNERTATRPYDVTELRPVLVSR